MISVDFNFVNKSRFLVFSDFDIVKLKINIISKVNQSIFGRQSTYKWRFTFPCQTFYYIIYFINVTFINDLT